MSFGRSTLLFLFLMWAAGCAVGPDYRRPPVNTPQTYRGDAAGHTNSLGDMPWREVFQDPTLQDLIGRALTNNYDARIAAARVEQARAIVAENRAAYFPQVNYGGAVADGRNVVAGYPYPVGGSAGVGYEAEGYASWEIDLWGRLRRLTESARAQLMATREVQANIQLILISDIASDYFQLLALDQELRVAEDTTNSFGLSLKLFSARLRGGVSSRLETSAAEAELASAAATIPELERQIVVVENQLKVLMGQSPGPIARDRKLLEEIVPPEVPPGVPSALLLRRPDVREAEDLVRSANALIGVAKADFFPNFTLTALFGQVSPELSAFTSGAANAYSLAANLSGPLFQGGFLKAQYRAARAAWEAAALQYESTVLNALQEVGNALVAREKLARVRVQQAGAVRAYEEAVHIANERYTAGHANYYEILQEQQLLFPAENALTQTELNQYLAIIQLYRSLGGGWR